MLSRVFFEEIYFKLGKPTRLFSTPSASREGICVQCDIYEIPDFNKRGCTRPTCDSRAKIGMMGECI